MLKGSSGETPQSRDSWPRGSDGSGSSATGDAGRTGAVAVFHVDSRNSAFPAA